MSTFCSYYNSATCRSCSLIELDYSAQILHKEKILQSALSHPLEISFVSRPLGFRNKIKLTVTGSKELPILGLWGEKDLDSGREILNCPLHHPDLNKLVNSLPDYIKLCLIEPYQISNRKGELKGLIAFISNDTQEMYLRFVLRSKESLDRIKKNLKTLQDNFPQLVCVSANIQPIPHAILEGEEEVFLTEKKFIEHQLDYIKFQIGPRAFVQTNQIVASALYLTACNWVKDLKVDRFCELFCGQGAFSFFSAPYVKAALGIEINSEAVANAQSTASRESLNHLQFKCSDAALVEKEVLEFGPDLILVNPPRRGLTQSLEILKKARAPYIIYSSCSYQSLASDIKVLSSTYSIQKVQLFDMFPHTEHFEVLTLLKLN